MSWYELTGCKKLVRFADKLFHFNVEGLVLFPFILYEDDKPSKTNRQRQKIHLQQQLETLVIFYYFIYWYDFWLAYWHYRDIELSHLKVRFEQEAIHGVCNGSKKTFWGWFNLKRWD